MWHSGRQNTCLFIGNRAYYKNQGEDMYHAVVYRQLALTAEWLVWREPTHSKLNPSVGNPGSRRGHLWHAHARGVVFDQLGDGGTAPST